MCILNKMYYIQILHANFILIFYQLIVALISIFYYKILEFKKLNGLGIGDTLF